MSMTRYAMQDQFKQIGQITLENTHVQIYKLNKEEKHWTDLKISMTYCIDYNF